MVAAPTAVTIAPKYNKALDKKAMVAAHAAVTMAPKNKNKLPSQQNFRKGTKPGVVSNNLRKKDNNTHILRFARCGSTTEKAGDIFPSDLKVYVNDSRFPISLRNSFDSFGKPIDISLHCRAKINHISVSWRNEKSIHFCWSLVRCKRRSYDEIMKGRAVSEHEKTAKLIKENFKR